MEEKFKELLSEVSSYGGAKENLGIVKRAWKFAKLAHFGQKRQTGDPYVSHSLETAKILASWKLDTPTIVAGILHDVVEDGAANEADLKKEFGEEIAILVEGVTKVSYLKLRGSTDEEFVENLRKMFFAMARDLRVILVKLADRLHNMKTLYALPQEKRVRIAKETLDVFAPLADRLGMGEVSAQLDDLAFPFVYSKDYEEVKNKASTHYKKAEAHIRKMRTTLLKELAKEKIDAKIDGRKKHLFSLWKKLERPEIKWDFSKVYDIVALRIIVDTVEGCYTALGLIHRHYRPVPSLGISDFIAQPKPNGYRSIHTRVFGPLGRIVEVQIRTKEMHEQAEYGVAAHWAYREAKTKGVEEKILEKKGIQVSESKLSWVKQLSEWQKEISDSKEFLRAVKFDALSHRIFVFSPKGDVYDLPVGSTPIDFAFAVHTDLGRYIKGAKVDGKFVPLDYQLKSGQVVEIIKSKFAKVLSSDWLEHVITTSARREIGKDLRKKN